MTDDDRRRAPRVETRVVTTDLQAGNVIQVSGVAHIKAGWAEVRTVSGPSPAGPWWVTTDRGTFLADPEAFHGVLTASIRS